MKAITREQPFASLVSIGAKTIGIRPWSIDYRGPLAIHAANTANPVNDSYYQSIFASAGLDDQKLPQGEIIAIVRLVGCRKVIPTEIPCYPELAFSNFIEGWYALTFTDIKPLSKPVPATGSARLWEWVYEDTK